MDWEAIGAIGEVLGAAGVIATLGYLAAQIRQSTRAQLAETYGRALDRVSTLQGRLSENAELSAIVRRGSINSDSLSLDDRIRFTWILYEMFTGFEFMFHQAQSKALSRAVWERWGNTLRWWISLPGVREWWESTPAPFTPDFSGFVASQLESDPLDGNAQARWRRYLGQDM